MGTSTARNNRKRPGRVDRARRNNNASMHRVEERIKVLESADPIDTKALAKAKHRLLELKARDKVLSAANSASRTSAKKQ
jgi:hypothetical protein